MSVQTEQAPFGFVEEIWGVEKFGGFTEGEPEDLFLPTTSGLYCCMVTPEGQFLYSMESYYEESNIINAVMINEDELLLSFYTFDDESGNSINKLVILNLETKEEKMMIDLKSVQVFDICTLPGQPGGGKFFILHTGKGI